MTFSNIKAIKVKNFRCLEELTIRFDNSPIVALVAGNDSGKSSVVKAVQAAIYNDEKDTKSYIRTGTKGFQIDIIFDDNVKITRTKTVANNTYTLYNADGTIKNTWDRMTQDIPEEIRAIFGVKIEDATGELLNLRTCESLLLFSLTKTTDNYKMVHSCISSELIEMTYIIGNGRIKEIEKTIAKSETLRDEMYSQANKIAVYSEDTINKLTQDHARVNDMLRLEGIIYDTCLSKVNVEEMQATVDATDPAKLQELIESKFSDKELDMLVNLEALVGEIENIRGIQARLRTAETEQLVASKIQEEEIDKLVKLQEFIQLCDTIQQKKGQTVDAEKLAVVEELREQMNILHQQLQELSDAYNLIHTISMKTATAQVLAEELQKAFEDLKANSTVRYDKDRNALVTNCEHCNEEVYFSLNDLQLVD